MPERAFREGVVAAKCGAVSEINPHAPGSDKYIAWSTGFIDAEHALRISCDAELKMGPASCNPGLDRQAVTEQLTFGTVPLSMLIGHAMPTVPQCDPAENLEALGLALPQPQQHPRHGFRGRPTHRSAHASGGLTEPHENG